jgi:putative acetyltransferase
MIRKYTEADCEGLIEVWSAASVVATPFLSDEFMSEERVNIRTKWIPMAETWVFDVGGNVAGFVALIGNEVGAIFVHPDYQGRGIGRALMDHAASLRDELFLDVFEENAIGRRFYDRYGFRFEDKHIHEDTGHMQLRLSYIPNDNTRLTDED